MPINSVNDLRPVEALYLLSEADKEKMTYENSLAAVLAYFSSKDLFKKREETKGWLLADHLPIDVTSKIYNISQLREYELKIFKAIEHNNAYSLMEHIEHLNLKEFLAENNLFDIERKRIFKYLWKYNIYTPNKKNEEIVKELLTLREQIADTIKNRSLNKDLLAMSYAFPSIQFNTEITDIAHEIKNTVELIRTSMIAASSSAATTATCGI